MTLRLSALLAAGWMCSMTGCSDTASAAAATSEAASEPQCRMSTPSDPLDPNAPLLPKQSARTCGTEDASAFTPSRPLGVGYKGSPFTDDVPDRVAYLTFDDGPSDWTRDFLAILESRGVHATFFINAKNLKGELGLDGTYTADDGQTVSYRDVLKETVEAGHAIGNHGIDHLDLGTLSLAEVRAQLDDNERLVNDALVRSGLPARPLTLIRPPWGSPWIAGSAVLDDPAASRELIGPEVALRGVNILWNVTSSDSAEWAVGESYSRQGGKVRVNPDVSYDAKVERIKRAVLEGSVVQAGEGAIILLHDTHNSTRDALADIIDGLIERGYSFGTAEDYVVQRFGRPSLELTPGPALFDVCLGELPDGCASFPDGASTCGRLWRAFDALGGESHLGKPVGGVEQQGEGGAISQAFERGRIELRPQDSRPCDMVWVPSGAR